MAYLTSDEQAEVVNAANSAGLGNPAARTALRAAVNQEFVAGNFIDNGGPALLQLYADLNILNPIEQLADGSVPLRDWLRRAGETARATQRKVEPVDAVADANLLEQPLRVIRECRRFVEVLRDLIEEVRLRAHAGSFYRQKYVYNAASKNP